VFTATHSTVIARSACDVFDEVADAGRQRSWNALVRSMERTSDGPLGVGTRWRGDIARVGTVDVELVEYEPPRRVVHVARPWMAEARHVWEVEELDGGCRLVQRGRMRPRAAGWLLAPLMPLIVRRQLRDCAVSLGRSLERAKDVPAAR
jgi:Polyketide cyclase / dehydrase and lipid transport